VSEAIRRLGAGLPPQAFDPGDLAIAPARPESRLENERALVEALASGDLELALVALSREGAALRGTLLPMSFWAALWDGAWPRHVDDWVRQGAPDGPMKQLLRELAPHLSQRIAHELIRRFGERLQQCIGRPSWARGLRRGAELSLLAPPLVGGKDVWLHTREAERAAAWVPPRGWVCPAVLATDWPEPALSLRLEVGSDGPFGVVALLGASDSDDRPMLWQRLRWIEPSTFAMGSSPREAGRQAAEGPLRKVDLTEGYWIADTACTQGLWRVVMGASEQRSWSDDFDDFPVTEVSPEEVSDFLARLNEVLQGCEVALPTEAEWECACRAGTRGAFWFGAEVNSQMVNARSGGPIRVASFPANPWGLYEMHGNVGEICRDWLRDNQRAVRDARDPVGETVGTGAVQVHAVRGGSFALDFGDARAAAVGKVASGEQRRDVGFRFILRAHRPAAR
jgi:formylglycine-generating enzyme required for sulfatase activity